MEVISLAKIILEKLKNRIKLLVFSQKKMGNIYLYKFKNKGNKKILFYFPDGKLMHLGDHLFFEPAMRVLKKYGLDIWVAPSPQMVNYFKVLNYKIMPEKTFMGEYDMIISRPEFFGELRDKENIVFYDYINGALKNRICEDIALKISGVLGIKISDESYYRPQFWEGIPLEEKKIDENEKYIIFNNYLDSGKRFNRRSYELAFERKIIDLKKEGYKIIHLGTEKEKKGDSREYPYVDLDLRGKTKVENLFYLASQKNIVANIGYDGFLMHLFFMNGKDNYIGMRDKVTKKREEITKKYLNPPFENEKRGELKYLEELKK